MVVPCISVKLSRTVHSCHSIHQDSRYAPEDAGGLQYSLFLQISLCGRARGRRTSGVSTQEGVGVNRSAWLSARFPNLYLEQRGSGLAEHIHSTAEFLRPTTSSIKLERKASLSLSSSYRFFLINMKNQTSICYTTRTLLKQGEKGVQRSSPWLHQRTESVVIIWSSLL